MNFDGLSGGGGGFGGFGLGGMGGMGSMGGGGGFGSDGEYNKAFDIDSKLYQLAAYQTTGGLLPDMSSPEEMLEYQTNVIKTFNHYKRRIQLGSCDFNFIKKQVLSENGPFKSGKYSLDEDIDNILEEGKKEDARLVSRKAFEEIHENASSSDVMDSLSTTFRNLIKDKKKRGNRIESALGESDDLNEDIDEDLDEDKDQNNNQNKNDFDYGGPEDSNDFPF